MYKFLLLATLLPAIILGQTPFRACPGGSPVPASVNIQGCTVLPCAITSGQTIAAQARGITTTQAATTVTTTIAASVLGLAIPFDIPSDLANACTLGITGATCPLAAGQTFDYELSYPITLPITGITAQLRVGLLDHTNATITCIEFDARIG